MPLINKQSPWVLHHLNQSRERPENVSHYENFCLISKVTHFPDLINMKYILKCLYFGFLKFTMSLDCYASPLNCDIILVNKGLFCLTVQSHWDPSPLKGADLIFLLLELKGRTNWRGSKIPFVLCLLLQAPKMETMSKSFPSVSECRSRLRCLKQLQWLTCHFYRTLCFISLMLITL